MEFRIRKAVLKDSIAKACNVASRKVKSEFDLGDRIKLNLTETSLTLTSSNGHLDFKAVIEKNDDNGLEVKSVGECIIEATFANSVINAIGGQASLDCIVDMRMQDGVVEVKDGSAAKARWAKLQTVADAREVTINMPKKCDLKHTFDTIDFVQCLSDVSKYAASNGYSTKIKFQMVCMHFMQDRIRFVCGTGKIFAVCSLKNQSIPDVGAEGKKFLVPAEQAEIITKSIIDSNKVTCTFVGQSCYIEADGIQMHLYGIPETDYINYEKHAFRTEEAVLIADCESMEYVKGTQLIGSVKDKDIEKETFYSCDFVLNAKENSMYMAVDERKSKASYEFDVTCYNIKEGEYKSHYSFKFLDIVSKACTRSHVRFYAIDPAGTIIVEPVDIGEAKDERGVPVSVENSNRDMFFFFGAVKEKDGNG